MESYGLNALGERATEIANKSGWFVTADNVPEKLMLVVGELSEAMEEYRVLGPNEYRLREVQFDVNEKPLGFPTEIADAIIRLVGITHALGIDLDAVVKQKMEFNTTRPFRHGGKYA